MPSPARTHLESRLQDFDELIAARDLVCPDGRGRGRDAQGAAILRSSVVLLSAAFEAYVEEVYDAAVDLVFTQVSQGERNTLKNDTSGKLNNASTAKVNRLFFNLGIPWIMKHRRVRWQKFSNASVQKELDRIVKARNEVAHGESPYLRKATLLRWKGVIQRLADRLDEVVADHVHARTTVRPW